MCGLPTAVDNGLEHDCGGLGVRVPSEGEPLGFGEGTSVDGTVKIGRGVSEDELLEKEWWPELYRWLRYRSGDTGAIISRNIQVPHPDVWLRPFARSMGCLLPELPYQGSCSLPLPRESPRSSGVDRDHRAKERSTGSVYRKKGLESGAFCL